MQRLCGFGRRIVDAKMDDTWRFNDEQALKKEEESSKYHTWGGWDILTPKTQEWSSNLVIRNPSGTEEPTAAYKTSASHLPLDINMSELEADAKEFHPRSQRPAVGAAVGMQQDAPTAMPKFSERNDEGFKFIVKTFAVECSRHLLLYSIPPSLTAEDLYNIMSAYGDIESMDCNRKDDIGVVLLSYFDTRDATTALERLSAPSMPVEAQYCISRVDQTSGQLYDEHKLLVKPKMKNDRGISLNDVIGLLGEHGEISNFINSGKEDKLVEFPDARALKMAVASSTYNNKITVSRIALPVKLYRLGLSLDKFLRCHNSAQSAKHPVFYGQRKSKLQASNELIWLDLQLLQVLLQRISLALLRPTGRFRLLKVTTTCKPNQCSTCRDKMCSTFNLLVAMVGDVWFQVVLIHITRVLLVESRRRSNQPLSLSSTSRMFGMALIAALR